MNDEIKRYITQHKDDLMSGMQDVAVLAERYRALSNSSSKLQKSVDRLKKEAIESHELVRLKTIELERIHLSNSLIRQLRQFAHAKSQLDHLLQSDSDVPLGRRNNFHFLKLQINEFLLYNIFIQIPQEQAGISDS